MSGSMVPTSAGGGLGGVSAALAAPGRSVALIDLSLLLRPGGVLDRLAAQGADLVDLSV